LLVLEEEGDTLPVGTARLLHSCPCLLLSTSRCLPGRRREGEIPCHCACRLHILPLLEKKNEELPGGGEERERLRRHATRQEKKRKIERGNACHTEKKRSFSLPATSLLLGTLIHNLL